MRNTSESTLMLSYLIFGILEYSIQAVFFAVEFSTDHAGRERLELGHKDFGNEVGVLDLQVERGNSGADLPAPFSFFH